MIRVLVGILSMYFIWGCKPEIAPPENGYDKLKESEAGLIVIKAIDRAGGWDNWRSKDNFSFYKNITHLDSSGAVEKNVRQHHIYNLKGGFKARMQWQIGDDKFLIINNGSEAKKYKNGIELTDMNSKNEAWNSSYGSHYVIGMPYKLADPGTRLTYEGIDSTTLDKPVHAVKVEYATSAGSTGGMHIWWYYFDTETFDLAGNYLNYGEGFSITTYELFKEIGSHKIHNKRHSYISNDLKERVMLRTIYENEEMAFNQNIDKNTFELL